MTNSIIKSHFKSKDFLSIEQQVELLINRGMVITDKNKIIDYLTKYNYQNFINGYNDIFFVNEQRSTNKYKDNITQDEIINLFNYDKEISILILKSILEFERKLSSCLVTTICNAISYLNKNKINSGEIFSLSKKQFKWIFINGFNTHFDYQDINKISKSLISFFAKNDSELCKKYNNNFNHVPIWVLSIYWSLGDTRNLIFFLRKSLFKDFLKMCNLNSKFTKNEFIQIIDNIRKIRNRCCHNNVVYNFTTKLEVNFFNKKRRLKIYDFIKLLDYCNNKDETTLQKKFIETFDIYFQSIDNSLKEKL